MNIINIILKYTVLFIKKRFYLGLFFIIPDE